MPRNSETKPAKKPQCTGGRSFGCKHDEHNIGKIPNVLCMTCKTRLGCSRCVQIPQELLCLNCHDWAHPVALAKHGHVVGFQKAAIAIREILDDPPF